MIIHLHFPFVTNYPALTTLFSNRCPGSSLALPWGIGRAQKRGCWKNNILFCSKTHVLQEIVLSILSGRGERRVPDREGVGRGRERAPLAGKGVDIGRSPKSQRHKPGDLDPSPQRGAQRSHTGCTAPSEANTSLAQLIQ